MKVKLEIPCGTFLIFEDLSEAAPLFKAVANAKLCKESGYDTNRKVEQCPVNEIPKLELIPDSYDIKPNDLMKELQDRTAQADKREYSPPLSNPMQLTIKLTSNPLSGSDAIVHTIEIEESESGIPICDGVAYTNRAGEVKKPSTYGLEAHRAIMERMVKAYNATLTLNLDTLESDYFEMHDTLCKFEKAPDFDLDEVASIMNDAERVLSEVSEPNQPPFNPLAK